MTNLVIPTASGTYVAAPAGKNGVYIQKKGMQGVYVSNENFKQFLIENAGTNNMNSTSNVPAFRFNAPPIGHSDSWSDKVKQQYTYRPITQDDNILERMDKAVYNNFSYMPEKELSGLDLLGAKIHNAFAESAALLTNPCAYKNIQEMKKADGYRTFI